MVIVLESEFYEFYLNLKDRDGTTGIRKINFYSVILLDGRMAPHYRTAAMGTFR